MSESNGLWHCSTNVVVILRSVFEVPVCLVKEGLMCNNLQSFSCSLSLVVHAELHGDVAFAIDRVDGSYLRPIIQAMRRGIVVPGVVYGIEF